MSQLWHSRLCSFVILATLSLAGCTASKPWRLAQSAECAWVPTDSGPSIVLTIRAEKGRAPLEGVAVQVVQTKLGALTDEFGTVELWDVPMGVCTLEVKTVGYAPVLVTDVIVNAGHTTTIADVRLRELMIKLVPPW